MPNSRATARRLRPSTRTARRTRPYISTWNIPPVSHEPCLQGNSSRKQDPAVANFYSAAAPRSRGALWPSFAPARIAPTLAWIWFTQRLAVCLALQPAHVLLLAGNGRGDDQRDSGTRRTQDNHHVCPVCPSLAIPQAVSD